MKKVVLYGMGKSFSQIIKRVTDEYEIIAICDIKFLNVCSEDSYHEIPLISPVKLEKFDYDFIVVCSKKFFESIRTFLIGNYYISEEKIVSERIFFKEAYLCDEQIISYYQNRVKKYNAIMTLDKSIFLHPFKNKKRGDKVLNLALIWESKNDIQKVDYNNTEIIWFLSYSFFSCFKFNEIMGELLRYYDVRRWGFYSGVVFEFTKRRKVEFSDAKIYIVSHKAYNVINNDLYETLMVGEDTKKDHGESVQGIDDLNPILNECTALYWIWRNSNASIVGLNHYRRIFCNDEVISYNNILDVGRLTDLLSKNDIILPDATFLDWSVYENISRAVGDELANQGRKIILDLLRKHHPSYCDSFLKVMDGNVMYACNMFITNHRIMDEYCRWLFSFIIDAAKSLNVSECTVRQKRTIGYFAETMMTVWLLRKSLIVHTLPIILL